MGIYSPCDIFGAEMIKGDFMKKVLFCFLVLLIAVCVSAQNATRVNTAIDSGTWTAITVDTQLSTAYCVEYSFFLSDDTSFKIADDNSGTNSTTFPANSRVSWPCMKTPDDGILFYAQSVSGTPTLTLLYQVK